MTLINHLRGEQVLSDPEGKVAETQLSFPDMSDLVGQDMAKRAMEITAVGGP
jgi:magnesium chelatase family protein